MIRILGTVFAGLLGLAFGSFLNVCLSRWPEGESIVQPPSHCRACGRALRWWENVPLASWLALRGRCRTCRAPISERYPLVEAAVGALWALLVWQALDPAARLQLPAAGVAMVAGRAIFAWLLVALALLDAEHLWLPDKLTLPGAALGLLLFNLLDLPGRHIRIGTGHAWTLASSLLEVLAAAGLILLIRWSYWLARRREGIGLGDAKLMALLAAWLGLPGALLSFVLGVTLGALVAAAVLIRHLTRRSNADWALTRLPLGTFLCIGGLVSSLWGPQLIDAYLRWAGF